MVLNAPVGSTQFCERKFTEKVRSLEPVHDDVAALENTNVSFTLLKFWTAKVSRYARMLQAAGTGFKLLLGGWHPDAHKALCSVASTIAARGLSTFSRARSILFQRHAAQLVTKNALCLMSGLLSDI